MDVKTWRNIILPTAIVAVVQITGAVVAFVLRLY